MNDELRPCPFCGGDAEIIEIDDGENAGGSCVQCKQCLASGNVEFDRKENFVANWNRRAAVNALPELLAERDRLREALKIFANLGGGIIENARPGEEFTFRVHAATIRMARAALNQETKP